MHKISFNISYSIGKSMLLFLLGIIISSVEAYGQNAKMYLYDANGEAIDKGDKVAYALQVETSGSNTIFVLYREQQVLSIGDIEFLDTRSLKNCVFGDYIGFNADGQIIEAQKKYYGYKLRSTYYNNGALQDYDSLVNNRLGGVSYHLSPDGDIVTISYYHNGDLFKPYYTVLSKDGYCAYNANTSSDKLYSVPVCHTECEEHGLLSQTYTANGIRLTASLQNYHLSDNLYNLKITVRNTSPHLLAFNPSEIRAWGGKGQTPSEDISRLDVLSAEDYARTLDKESIVVMARQYVQTTDVDPYREYSGSLRIKAAGSHWLAVTVSVGGVTYPFYFTLYSGASKDDIHAAVISKGASGMLAMADSQSANRIFNDRQPFPGFDTGKALSLKELVSADLDAAIQSVAGKVRPSQPSASRGVGSPSLSATFVKRANTCISSIKRLESAKNADQVYSACLAYYRSYKLLRAMRKNTAESKMYSNINQRFTQVCNEVSNKLRCSGAVMRAQLDGLK